MQSQACGGRIPDSQLCPDGKRVRTGRHVRPGAAKRGKVGRVAVGPRACRVELEKDGKRETLSQFKDKDIRRVFPFVEAEYAKSSHISSNIKLKTFCPLAVNDAETSSLPVLMLKWNVPTRQGKRKLSRL